MNLDKSDQVYEHFRATVETWTPTAALHSAQVLFAPVSFDPKVVQSCSTILSDAEVTHADNFLVEAHKNHFIQRRAFRRFCAALALGSSGRSLSQMIFEETEEGRPYLPESPGLWFSFSSCQFGFLCAWSFTHAVGVDIEDRIPDLETVDLAHQFFSASEAKVVDEAGDAERVDTFFQLWSLKESALKSIGKGLPFGLDTFGFDLSPNLRVSCAPAECGGPDRFHPHLLEGTGTCAALVTHLK